MRHSQQVRDAAVARQRQIAQTKASHRLAEDNRDRAHRRVARIGRDRRDHDRRHNLVRVGHRDDEVLHVGAEVPVVRRHLHVVEIVPAVVPWNFKVRSRQEAERAPGRDCEQARVRTAGDRERHRLHRRVNIGRRDRQHGGCVLHNARRGGRGNRRRVVVIDDARHHLLSPVLQPVRHADDVHEHRLAVFQQAVLSGRHRHRTGESSRRNHDRRTTRREVRIQHPRPREPNRHRHVHVSDLIQRGSHHRDAARFHNRAVINRQRNRRIRPHPRIARINRDHIPRRVADPRSAGHQRQDVRPDRVRYARQIDRVTRPRPTYRQPTDVHRVPITSQREILDPHTSDTLRKRHRHRPRIRRPRIWRDIRDVRRWIERVDRHVVRTGGPGVPHAVRVARPDADRAGRLHAVGRRERRAEAVPINRHEPAERSAADAQITGIEVEHIFAELERHAAAVVSIIERRIHNVDRHRWIERVDRHVVRTGGPGVSHAVGVARPDADRAGRLHAVRRRERRAEAVAVNRREPAERSAADAHVVHVEAGDILAELERHAAAVVAVIQRRIDDVDRHRWIERVDRHVVRTGDPGVPHAVGVARPDADRTTRCDAVVRRECRTEAVPVNHREAAERSAADAHVAGIEVEHIFAELKRHAAAVVRIIQRRIDDADRHGWWCRILKFKRAEIDGPDRSCEAGSALIGGERSIVAAANGVVGSEFNGEGVVARVDRCTRDDERVSQRRATVVGERRVENLSDGQQGPSAAAVTLTKDVAVGAVDQFAD